MNWYLAQIAEHHHADLVAEAANRRLVGETRRAAGGTVPAARAGSWRVLLPWRRATAR